MPVHDVRPLGMEDAGAWERVCRDSFGYAPSSDDAREQLTQAGAFPWGLFDGGNLVATVTALEFDSRWGGADVRTVGISAATVLPEYRGRGFFRPLLEAALTEAENRGALVSTLFPTARAVYRRMGFESVARLDTLDVRTSDLSRSGVPGHQFRRGDLSELGALYRAWAEPFNGPASMLPGQNPRVLRVDPRVHKVTMIEGVSGSVGGIAWRLPSGDGAAGVLEIADVVATGADALDAVPAFLAGFAAIASTVRLRGMTPAWQQMVLPDAEAEVAASSTYMLRVLTVKLFEELRYPQGVVADLCFRSGRSGWRLRIQDGTAACLADDSSTARAISALALAAIAAGAQTSGVLRARGLIVGGDPAEDVAWDRLFSGRPAAVNVNF
ncbi:hypothetical protein ASD13_05555 [Microbacterium sp. Root1433D1]|uniref:GNAT family N-acetyltransferase n=1 Tax=Microbacterium sp. Root1433D1 TaxID=1736463 RepID=UPI000712A3BE|nr:GNAT family N-acetyltransferase [Microbacterium sp. Root1433D1]KQY78118.1 hypothetical protein ASD13_05555 [Microbacterium sp. Root1433D1]